MWRSGAQDMSAAQHQVGHGGLNVVNAGRERRAHTRGFVLSSRADKTLQDIVYKLVPGLFKGKRSSGCEFPVDDAFLCRRTRAFLNPRWDEAEAGLLRREPRAGAGGSGGDVQHRRGRDHQSVHPVLREEQASPPSLSSETEKQWKENHPILSGGIT